MVGQADAWAETFGALSITHIRAAPAVAGASTQLHMTISNEGYDDLHVLRVTSPVAAGCRFMFASEPGVSLRLDTVTIRADEMVVFDGGMWIELVALKKALADGDRFTATLHFASGGKVTIPIIVHPLPPQSTDARSPHA